MPIDTTWITRLFSSATKNDNSECNEIHFKDASDFLSCLSIFPLKQTPFWGAGEVNKTASWLFRGHWDASWDLLPSAHRQNKPFEEFGFPLPDLKSTNNADYWQKMVQAEVFALEHFQTLANQSSLPCDFSSSVYDEMATMREDYQRSFFRDVEFFPKSPWYPIMAKAQHHKLPTRLLDFSSDGLRSAYFAGCKLWNDRDSDPATDERLCVWVFHEADFADLKSEPDIKIKSTNWLKIPAVSQLGSNLATQQGSLILFEGANHYFEKNGRWPDFFEYIDPDKPNAGRKKKFIKLTLDQMKAKEMLQLLLRMGVSPVVVYPSLDNVSETLKYKHWLFN